MRTRIFLLALFVIASFATDLAAAKSDLARGSPETPPGLADHPRGGPPGRTAAPGTDDPAASPSEPAPTPAPAPAPAPAPSPAPAPAPTPAPTNPTPGARVTSGAPTSQGSVIASSPAESAPAPLPSRDAIEAPPSEPASSAPEEATPAPRTSLPPQSRKAKDSILEGEPHESAGTVSAGLTGGPEPALTLFLVPVALVGAGAVALATFAAAKRPRSRISPPRHQHGATRPAPKAAPVPADVVVPATARPATPPRAGVPGILHLAQDAVARGRLDEALAWFDTALHLAPDLGVAHYCRGVTLAEMGRHRDAFDALTVAARLDPEDASVRYHLARAAARVGREREALRGVAAVLRALPELAEDAAKDPAFERLRDHPRFLAVVGRL